MFDVFTKFFNGHNVQVGGGKGSGHLWRKIRADKQHRTHPPPRDPRHKSFGGSKGGPAPAMAAPPTDSRPRLQLPRQKGVYLIVHLVASTAVPFRKAGELGALKLALCTMLGMYTKEQIKMTLETERRRAPKGVAKSERTVRLRPACVVAKDTHNTQPSRARALARAWGGGAHDRTSGPA